MRLRDVSRILHYDTRKKPVDQRVNLEQVEGDLRDDWGSGDTTPGQSRYLIYLAFGTFLFFLVTIGIAYFVRFAGIDRTVSASKIAILTEGPNVVDGGASVPLTIRVANRNPVSIRGAVLSVSYPSGVYSSDDDGFSRLRSEDFSLGMLETGQVVSTSVSPVIYGREGERKMITYTLQYRTDGSSQPAMVTDSYEVLLRTSPLQLHQPRYTNPVAGKEVTFTATVQSNTTEVIPAVFVRLQYPTGFTPRSFQPLPFNEGTLWKIPSLAPGSKRSIRVTGVIRGEERHEQSLLATAFVAPTGEYNEDDWVEVAGEDSVFSIEKSFLDVALRLNDTSADRVIIAPAETVLVSVDWSNIDSARLEDLEIVASLSGSGLDESSVRVRSGGYYDEVNKEIIWDQKQLDRFASVGVGARGSLSFEFRALPDRVEFSQAQKYIRVAVSARAKRVATNSSERIQDIAVSRADLRSSLQVVANTLYATSTLQNRGPIPPRVGQQTSYTLKYFVKNGGNDLTDVSLVIPLTRESRLTNFTSGLLPGEWSYDEAAHVITVSLPSLSAFGAQSNRSLEFQVVIEPTSRDLGSRVFLTKDASYEAYDTYVQKTLTGTIGSLSTYITAEPIGGFISSQVVE